MSYLIIEPITDITASLSMNMMKNNKIQGLLDMECRYVDNKMYLYYEIQGMECLKEYISEHSISYNLARQLYLDIAQAVLNGEEFFLSENSYVMDLEYIFWDKKNKRAKFCCVPELQKDFQADIKKVTEELIEYIGHNDRSAAEFIYGIYGLITDNGFIISDAKAYINGFRPGKLNSAGYNTKSQGNGFTFNKEKEGNIKEHYAVKEDGIEFIPASVFNKKTSGINEKNTTDENIITEDRENIKETVHKKYILCIDKASLPFREKEKGYINIYLEDGGTGENGGCLEFSVGRCSNCSLILPVCFVSRRHAVFYIENGNIYIEDAGSVNGTFINNEKIPANVKILCNINDIISFAGIKCRLSCK